jgi:hypothetical protein
MKNAGKLKGRALIGFYPLVLRGGLVFNVFWIYGEKESILVICEACPKNTKFSYIYLQIITSLLLLSRPSFKQQTNIIPFYTPNTYQTRSLAQSITPPQTSSLNGFTTFNHRSNLNNQFP